MLKALSRFVWTLWGGMDKDFSVKFALETSSTLAILGHTDLFIQAMAQMSSVNKRLSKLGPFSVTGSPLPLLAARNERLWSHSKRGQLRLAFAEWFYFMTFYWNLVLTWKIIIILVHETPLTIILNCLQMQSFTHQKPLWCKNLLLKIISKTPAALGYDCCTDWFLGVIWLSTHNSEDYSRTCSCSTGSSFGLFQSLQCPILPDKGDGSSGKEIELVRKYR